MYDEQICEALMTRRQLVAFEIDYFFSKGNVLHIQSFLHHYHPTEHVWGVISPTQVLFPGITRVLPYHIANQ